MKKYSVSGAGVHSIKLVECASKPKKAKGVLWFDTLLDAKEQVLKNQSAEIDRLLEEERQAIRRMNIIREHITIMKKPINLDIVTDDYLISANNRMKELNDKIASGEASIF
jgi:hypothetical protein